MGKKILYVVNDPGFFVSHRLPLAVAAQSAGYEVHVASPEGASVGVLDSHGLCHHAVPLSRGGLNVVSELRLALALYRLFRKIKPDVVHLVTIKPVFYGGLAARLARVPGIIAAMSGLGFVFTGRGWRKAALQLLVTSAYKTVFSQKNARVIFQNPDDLELMLSAGVVGREKCVIIRGSGVDLSEYGFVPEPDGVPLVLFAARLLRDKGVVEFVRAATSLKHKGVAAHFVVAGMPDPHNPASVTQEQVDAWAAEGHIEFVGYCRDMPELLKRTNLVVLPSYREGLPKVLIEAASCGRAVVTCDVPGCRHAIEDGRTGVLVPAGDDVALARAIEMLIEDPGLRHRMGVAGRELAEREFSIHKVVAKHMELYSELVRLT